MWFDGYGNALWTTKDMRRIPIFQMETSHINACLAMILIRPEIRPGYAKHLIKELERRLNKEKDNERTKTADHLEA
jgi:hypothetical protein